VYKSMIAIEYICTGWVKKNTPWIFCKYFINDYEFFSQHFTSLLSIHIYI